VALLDLAPHDQSGGAGHVRPGPAVGPRRTGQPGTHGHVQQRVPGRMEVNLIDAVPEPVVGTQHRRVPVGHVAPALRLLAAGQLAQAVQVVE
jgi:hypothetical protein